MEVQGAAPQDAPGTCSGGQGKLWAFTHRSEAPVTRVLSKRTQQSESGAGEEAMTVLGAGFERAQLCGARKYSLLFAWKVESVRGRWGISLQMQLRSYLGFVPHECTVICISA